jgi:hypothetical protein
MPALLHLLLVLPQLPRNNHRLALHLIHEPGLVVRSGAACARAVAARLVVGAGGNRCRSRCGSGRGCCCYCGR